MLTSLLAALTIGYAGPEDTMAMVPGKVNGYLMLPAKVVCEGQIKSLNWSPDNQYLVTIRSQVNMTRQTIKRLMALESNPNARPNPADIDPTRNSVVVWNVADAKSTQVWAGRSSHDQCDQIALAGTTLYLLVRQAVAPVGTPEEAVTRTSLLRCQLGSSSAQVVRTFDTGTYLRIAAVDQNSKSILMSGSAAEQRVLVVVSGSGISLYQDRNQLPKGIADALTNGSWTWIGEAGGNGMEQFGAPAVEAPSVGVVTKVDEEQPKVAVKKPEKDLAILLRTFSPATKEIKSSVRALVYDDPEKPGKAYGVIATGVGTRFALATDNSALAYTLDNFLVVRDIVSIPIDIVKKAKEDALRAATISNAKQVGLAMIMFAADYDDNLPANLSNDQILPYLKNADLLNGFVMTWGGGNLNKVENPAETELGYVTGPGGRAIIYADGHVKWKAD